MSPTSAERCFALVSCFFNPENGGDMFLRNVSRVSRVYKAIHIELFITTAVRTSNPVNSDYFLTLHYPVGIWHGYVVYFL
jgi:hypothetical protein